MQNVTTLNYQRLLSCRIPINSIVGLIARTYNKQIVVVKGRQTNLHFCLTHTWRFRGSYTWGYKSPIRVFRVISIVILLITPLIATLNPIEPVKEP